MGMAASQARYLALVARKSNCEYEGQQINQSRLALSNQSADLFNQMMGLEVPKTPSKSDYTYTTYTFDNGDYKCTIDKWNRLSDSEGEGYNYAVTYHYDKIDNVGFQKYKYDPQIQFSLYPPSSTTDPYSQVVEIEQALEGTDVLKKIAETKEAEKNAALANAKKVSSYKDVTSFQSVTATYDATTDIYTVAGTKAGSFKRYANCTPEEKERIQNDLSKLIDPQKYGIFTSADVGGANLENIYYDSATQSIAFRQDLDTLISRGDTPGTLCVYPLETMEELDKAVTDATAEFIKAEDAYNKACDDVYASHNIPTKIGNTKLYAISKSDFDESKLAAIVKIINQMKKEEIDTNITKCFSTVSGEYTVENYIGGLYTFDQASISYFTTYYDLYNSIVEGSGINNIDDQKKLPTYGTQDMSVKEEKTSRALIEKDKSGRFTSVKFEDDSLVYELKATSETDEVAYEDAMNQYAYDKSVYDKQVQDINAMTSIIQRQDQQLELRLKQLDTEQNALATEIDAVAKVVKDNVEKSYKTFSG